MIRCKVYISLFICVHSSIRSGLKYSKRISCFMNKSIFPLVKRFMIEIEAFRYTILNASILKD